MHTVIAFVVGAILGAVATYAFRGKVHAEVVQAGSLIGKGASAVATGVASKV